MVYRILALDPGGTTGWASYTAERLRVGPGQEWEYYQEKFACGHIADDKHEHHKELWTFLGTAQTSEFVLITESFEFRNLDKRHRDNINLMSREYIGIATLFYQTRMEGRDHQRYQKITAGIAKGFIPDTGPQANKKIRDAGLWHPNHKHAMDATRHLLWYLVNRDNRIDLVRKWWSPSRS